MDGPFAVVTLYSHAREQRFKGHHFECVKGARDAVWTSLEE